MNSYVISQLQKKQQLRVEDLLNKIDADGDGAVSEEEFVSNRPQEVSEEQSKQRWSQLDVNNAGSLTGNQFLWAMDNLKPPQEPPLNDLQSSSESSSSVSSLSSDSNSDVSTDLVNAILNAIKQYKAATGQTSSTSTNDDLTVQGSPPSVFDTVGGSDSSSSSTSKAIASDELVMALMNAIKEYTTTNQSGFSSAEIMAISTTA
jgi:hypothetical protein